MNKLIVTILALVMLAGCNAENVYPYMVDIAVDSCAQNGGYYSLHVNDGVSSYEITVHCKDGTYDKVDVPFASLKKKQETGNETK